MKILISGNSGLGKTTLIHELARRGYTAIDSDEAELAVFIDRETGLETPWPEGYIDWKRYAWNWREEKLLEVLNRDITVFLGGINNNQNLFYHRFDKLFNLTMSPTEHLRRMRARPKREFGDDELNIQNRLKKYPILLEEFKAAGFTPLDASGTVEETANALLKQLGLPI